MKLITAGAVTAAGYIILRDITEACVNAISNSGDDDGDQTPPPAGPPIPDTVQPPMPQIPGGGDDDDKVSYPNLRPNEPIIPIQRRELASRNGKWKSYGPGNTWTPKGRYDFVSKDGKIYIAPKDSGHVNISRGSNVDYAGEVHFSNSGRIKSWNNNSGHYYPNARDAHQAGLPMDKFRPVK